MIIEILEIRINPEQQVFGTTYVFKLSKTNLGKSCPFHKESSNSLKYLRTNSRHH